MPRLVKRACDSCIVRKVRCDGSLPCQTCQTATRQVQCTYIKPVQKRGPKFRRAAAARNSSDVTQTQETASAALKPPPKVVNSTWAQDHPRETVISSRKLARIIDEYHNHSYSVWPVVKSDVLLDQLNAPFDANTYCLAAALCAATMAQLNLPAIAAEEDNLLIDSGYLARECIRIREQHSYREHLDVRSVLVSFFLHVYHAKVNKRNSAMMFIQEAISSAKLLGLDRDNGASLELAGEVVDNGEILFSLLWVSERGYAMHLGLTPSYAQSFCIPAVDSSTSNVHVHGLLELARLFATFDQCSDMMVSTELLIASETALHRLSMCAENAAVARLADYCITREWMRTIIWQRALSLGMLSSRSSSAVMTFSFPVQVSRDLLSALRGFSSEDLLPLGRDQLLKCFEVANTLADTLLCNAALSERSALSFGPHEFLHGLYQKLRPFLSQDHMLDSILRGKTAEALSSAPCRFWSLRLGESTELDILSTKNTYDNSSQDGPQESSWEGRFRVNRNHNY
ncbi:hypothetical protein VTN77DRAFT_6412 [Rasamsonia byssochlamydoides]|uniref:uncharacterized protein n=1 Tax=Rasamsonia byssochlamydoides TaxID=89139 RepID=UPI0037420BF7